MWEGGAERIGMGEASDGEEKRRKITKGTDEGWKGEESGGQAMENRRNEVENEMRGKENESRARQGRGG